MQVASWIVRARSLEPVLFLFVGTVGLTLVLANWLHIVPAQRPSAMAYVAVVVLPLSAWITEIPALAKRPPAFQLGIRVLAAGALLTVALFPLLRSWLSGGFDFAGP